ncbi:hypothetical protein CCUS01_01558 [Colletotrichum cuscutae]|uniref:Nephrocystin 3-like N-terminal domain-containing protein n=1 Tax=Colletotrichum cuscutae TaxID=1209917 RepID=A0AAI9UTU7_9PEZI|nr:hypothetical protein CCUS01_01558 [Colletotrichum cuscutae]
MQYDLGKIVAGAEIQRTAIPRTLHHSIGKAITVLRAKHDRVPSQVPSILKERFKTLPHYGRPTDADRLFLSNYNHPESVASCDDCDETKLMPRRARSDNDPAIYYGVIASGNQVMKNATERDSAARTLHAVCFEMEAAGIMYILPCLPIRGICDYADSHKNKAWQRYAAAVAAACARELLSVLPLTDSGTRAAARFSPPQVLLDQHEKQTQLMESLKFDQMESRRLTVKRAHNKTCTWFIKHPDYCAWLDEEKLKLHHGFLWLRGKPGAGKSTIMKFTLSKMQKDRHWSPLVISFFFNARGEHLERSIEGMYRSLLLQLFQGYPQLRSVLNERYSNQQEYEACPSLEVLKDMFSEAVLSLGQLRLTCFIDALDECDEQQVTDMVREFEDLAEEASEKGIAFRICFSSRHYPYIVIKRGATMTLENQPGHTQDMENYVKSRLRINNPTLVENIQLEHLEKAAGVFLWLILVVDILNTEYSQGGLALKKRLVEIPSDLDALFKDILTRDSKKMEHMFLCVIWILCAKRPLRPNEFYHALWSGLSQQDLVDPQPPRVTSLDEEDDAIRCVIGFSKGLAEITKSTKPTVQFIHESVRDYLIKAGGLTELWPDIGFDWELLSHEKLKKCCEFYLGHYLTSTSITGESLEQYPFMEYTIQQVFFHADVAAAGISQHQFLSQFPLKRWIEIHNHFEKHKVRRYTPQATQTYILAELNCSRLIRTRPSEELQCRSAERYGYSLFAALAHGNSESVAALLEVPSVIYSGRNTMERFNHRKDLENFKMRTPLSWAAQGGQLDMVMLLLKAKNTADEFDRGGYSPLMLAARNGHEMIVRLLIQAGSNTNAVDKGLCSPLHHASAGGSEVIVRLLIEHGALINTYNQAQQSALHLASQGGHSKVVKLLLKNRADVNANAGESSPLQLACKSADYDTIKLLIENGAEVNWGEPSPLQLACQNAAYDTVKLLVENEAEINTENGTDPPLDLACARSDYDTIKVLVENGARINPEDTGEPSPLYYAFHNNMEAITKLLIDHGANLNVRYGRQQQMLLHEASLIGHHSVCKLLLKNGANPNAKDYMGFTPLIVAAAKGHTKVGRILCSKL